MVFYGTVWSFMVLFGMNVQCFPLQKMTTLIFNYHLPPLKFPASATRPGPAERCSSSAGAQESCVGDGEVVYRGSPGLRAGRRGEWRRFHGLRLQERHREGLNISSI